MSTLPPLCHARVRGLAHIAIFFGTTEMIAVNICKIYFIFGIGLIFVSSLRINVLNAMNVIYITGKRQWYIMDA